MDESTYQQNPIRLLLCDLELLLTAANGTRQPIASVISYCNSAIDVSTVDALSIPVCVKHALFLVLSKGLSKTSKRFICTLWALLSQGLNG